MFLVQLLQESISKNTAHHTAQTHEDHVSEHGLVKEYKFHLQS